MSKLEEVKIDSLIDNLISERVVGLLKVVENQLQVYDRELTADEKGELSVMLYEGLFEFFKGETKKHEAQIAHLKNLMVGKDSIYVANLTRQIEVISETVHRKEQSVAYDIIHEWEKTLEGSDVQAN